jgi:ribonuclease T2
MRKVFSLAVFVLAVASAPLAADVRLDGTFVAREACPAYRSIRNQTNPGSVRIEPGSSYPLVAKNKPDATYYLIEIAGAEPLRRWVAVGCGETAGSSGSTGGAGGGTASGPKPRFVLSVSWEPAFCESSAGGGKAECATQSEGRFDATHFSLHGLWPQPRARAYCDVAPDLVAADRNHDWDRLPEPDLTSVTRKELERVMPGTQSRLERHEWIKHGTCFDGEPPEQYFARAIALVDQLNASRARELFAGNIGSEVTSASIRAAFDASFGAGAGARVRVSCDRDGGRKLIAELTIGLVGEIGPDPSLGQLIAASAPTDPGCPSGVVDPVGRQ